MTAMPMTRIADHRALPVATPAGAPQSEIDRAQAAAVLRSARHSLATHADASDACQWALTLLPASRAAQRAMIDWLMRSSAWNDAAALISVALLQHRGERDWKFWHRRARVMLRLGRLAHAQQAIDRAFELRGDERHLASLLLAADVASARGDNTLALMWLHRADLLRPRCAEIMQRLVPALLAADRADDAAEALDEADDAAPELVAAVLLARQRPRDAREHLETALALAIDPVRRRELTMPLIDVLERCGDWPALRAMALEETAMAEAIHRADEPAAPGSDTGVDATIMARLARAALMGGEFVLANALGQHVLANAEADATARAEALRAMCAATGAMGQADHARRLLVGQFDAEQVTSPKPDASLWLSTLLGAIVADQCDIRGARRAGADPAAGVLVPLLTRAVATFDAALAGEARAEHDNATESWNNAARWRRYRAACERLADERGVRQEPRSASHVASPEDAHMRVAA